MTLANNIPTDTALKTLFLMEVVFTSYRKSLESNFCLFVVIFFQHFFFFQVSDFFSNRPIHTIKEMLITKSQSTGLMKPWLYQSILLIYFMGQLFDIFRDCTLVSGTRFLALLYSVYCHCPHRSGSTVPPDR